MRIDMHTHAADDLIADEQVSRSENINGYKAYAPKTVNGLLARMDDHGIDKSVVLNVVSDARNVGQTNDWAHRMESSRVIMFGAIHPGLPDPGEEVRRLKGLGFRGIKIHPAGNAFYPDDRRFLPVYEEAGDDLVVVFHSGAVRLDGRDPIYAHPERIAWIAKNFPRMKIVAAHFGGSMMLDEAFEYVIGHGLFIDTSWTPTLRALGSAETILKAIRKNGVENVLFGTDSPFNYSPKGDMEYLASLPLKARELDLILGENARALLGIGGQHSSEAAPA